MPLARVKLGITALILYTVFGMWEGDFIHYGKKIRN
jgi:hypothetical protein